MTEIFKALADDNRLRIVNVLLGGELCVCEIEYLLGMTQTNVSRHLKILKTAGIIERNKQAQWIHYRIREDFRNGNPDLLEHLKKEMDTHTVCKADTARLRQYKASDKTCADIRILQGKQ
jgi:ArsR family transcriptional regulator, arsenate/arsenite/antimonite-responsive transcriptional repressor